MIGYWSYTVILTYLSLISAAFGIGFAASDRPMGAVICLLLCGFLDLFDGKVARTKKDRTDEEKCFGAQIDSLSDLVAFGALPAFIGYCVGLKKWYEVIFLAIFVLCGLIRLAYFNVLEIQRDKAGDTTPNKGFIGMPITMAALIFPVLFIFAKDVNDVNNMGEYFKWLYMGCLIICSILFVVKIHFTKPGKKGVIVMVVLGALMLAAILLRFFLW